MTNNLKNSFKFIQAGQKTKFNLKVKPYINGFDCEAVFPAFISVPYDSGGAFLPIMEIRGHKRWRQQLYKLHEVNQSGSISIKSIVVAANGLLQSATN